MLNNKAADFPYRRVKLAGERSATLQKKEAMAGCERLEMRHAIPARNGLTERAESSRPDKHVRFIAIVQVIAPGVPAAPWSRSCFSNKCMGPNSFCMVSFAMKLRL